MSYSIAITEAQLFAALGTFIQFATGLVNVRGIDNGVAAPIGSYCVMTPLGKKRLSTNEIYQQPNATPTPAQTLSQAMMQTVQLDFYGPTAGDTAGIFTTAWRDGSTCLYFSDNFPGTIQPLDNSDPVQLALVNGEQVYEQRWTVRANMQYNAVVTLGQQYFTGVKLGIVDVDATIPP